MAVAVSAVAVAVAAALALANPCKFVIEQVVVQLEADYPATENHHFHALSDKTFGP